MKAIILAAGQGTRLKKYTQNLPKGMLEFDGKTIIERQIEMYRAAGLNKIIVVRGFAGDKIKYPDVTYYTNTDFANTNMVESLMAAKDEFDDDVIISYSDILFSGEMLSEMMKADGDFVCAVDSEWQAYWKMRYDSVDFDTESLKVDDDGNIVSLGLPDVSPEEIDARYVGLLKFSKGGLALVCKILERDYTLFADKGWKQSGKPIRKAYMTDLLQAVTDEGAQVKASFFKHGWIEFDTNEDYEKACEWVKDGRIKNLIML